MAISTIVDFVSDLSGDTIHSGESIEFSFEGEAFRLDLTSDEAVEMRAVLAKYIKAGRNAKKEEALTQAVVNTSHLPDNNLIRMWAEANGYRTKPAGRIPEYIRRRYLEQFK